MASGSFLSRLSTPRLGTIITVCFVSLVLWFLPDFIGQPQKLISVVFLDQFVIVSWPDWLSHIVQFVVVVLIFLYINRLCERMQVIPQRSMMPLFMGLFLTSCISYLQIFTEGTIAFVLFVFSFGQFLSIYNHDQKVTSAFNIFLLLSIASLFVTEYIYLMPLFLLGMIILRSFSFKMFLASVIGLLVPYLITLSSFYFFDSMALIENIWSNHTIYRFAEWPSISNAVVLYGVFLLVMTLLSMVSLFMASMNFKVNVRLNFVFINWSFFLTLVLMFLFLNNLLFLLYIPFFFMVLLLSLYFTINRGKFTTTLLLLLILFSVIFRLVYLLYGI